MGGYAANFCATTFFLFRVTMSAVSFSWPQQVLSIRSQPSSLHVHKANPYQDVQEWHLFKRSYYLAWVPSPQCIEFALTTS